MQVPDAPGEQSERCAEGRCQAHGTGEVALSLASTELVLLLFYFEVFPGQGAKAFHRLRMGTG